MNTESSPAKSKMALWKKLGIGLIIFIVLFKVAEGFNSDSVESTKRPQSKLNMAYVVAKRTLKEGLKDPDSFQEISHKEYYESGADSAKNNMQVVIEYRAKNSFGGYALEKKAFNFDSSGVIKESYTID